MKKCLLFSLSLFLAFLSGCTGQGAAAVSETLPATEPQVTEQTTAPMEEWVFEWPTGAARERTLEGFELTLPQGMTREDASPQRASLTVDGQVVGGVLVMDLDSAVVFHPSAGDHDKQVIPYLRKELMPEVPADEWSYYAGGDSQIAHHVIVMGTLDGRESIHYLFRYVSFYVGKSFEEDIYYDLWFDRRYVDDETIEAIASSVTVPSIEEEAE